MASSYEELKIKITADTKDLKALQRDVNQAKNELAQANATFAKGSQELLVFENRLKAAQNALNGARDSIKQAGVSAKMSSAQWLEWGENMTVVTAGAVIGIQKVYHAFMDLIQEANKLQSALMGLQSIAKFKGIDPKDATDAIRNLDLVRSGLLNVGDASLAMKNLLASNFTLEQSIELLKAFGDAASFNRQASLDFGYAVTSATEGIKNGNSILVDNAGITKNLSIILKEMGFAETDVSNVTRDLNVRTALYNGLLKESAGFVGDASRYAETYAGKQQLLSAKTTLAQQSLGYLAQEITDHLLGAVTSAVSGIGELVRKMIELDTGSKLANEGIKTLASIGFANLLIPGLGIVIEQLRLADYLMGKVFGGDKKSGDITSGFPKGNIADQFSKAPVFSDPNNPSKDFIKQTLDTYQKQFDAGSKQIRDKLTPTIKDLKKQLENIDKDLSIKSPKGKMVDETKAYILSIQEEIELQKLLKTLTLDFLKTKESELRSQLDITTADKDRLKVLKEINSVIQEQTEFVQKLIEVQKNQATRFNRADSSNRDSDALRTNRNILGNATSSPQEIGNINDKSYQQQELERGYELLMSSSATILSNTQQLFDILNIGTETFVYKMIEGFQTVSSVINSIVTILNTIQQVKQGFNILTSLFSFIPGAGAAGAFAGGAGQAFGGRNIGNLSTGGGQGSTINKIYINSTLDTQKFFGDGVTTFYKNRNLNTVG